MSERQNHFIRRFFIVAACALLALAPATFAQVTTSTLTGSVMAADGSALPGVTVEAVHVPTGTRKEEKLLPPTVLPKVHTLRRALAGTDPMTAMKMLLERLQKFPSNEAFLKSF